LVEKGKLEIDLGFQTFQVFKTWKVSYRSFDLKVNKYKTKLVYSPDGSGILFCFCKT